MVNIEQKKLEQEPLVITTIIANLEPLLAAKNQSWAQAKNMLLDLIATTPPQQEQEPVALHEVGLTRDIYGVCIVTVNGREAIRDSGDIINHFATLDWFALGKLCKKSERDIDSMEVRLYNRGWNDSITALYTTPPESEWVNLTDKEINNLSWGFNARDFARNIEAKLKEKNT